MTAISDRRLACALIGLLLLTSAAFAQTPEPIKIVAVTNAADFHLGLPRNGSLASLFCTGLQGEPGIVYATQFPLSNRLGDVSVSIDAVPAPILAIAFLNGYQQINIQMPWNLFRDPSDLAVSQGNREAHLETIRHDPSELITSVFFADAKGFGIIRHASDYSMVTVDKPAHSGEDLIAYGINLGAVKNVPVTGAPAPFELPFAPLDISSFCTFQQQLNIGKVGAGLSYAGLAPGTVGVYQMNFTLPAISDVGDLPMTITTTIGSGVVGICTPSQISTIIYPSRSVLIPIR